MPTYEYECTSPRCRRRWELFQSIKAEPERTCPACGKRTATRLFGIGAAILSGGRAAEPAESAAPAAAAKPAEGTAAGSKDAASAAGPAKADAAKPAADATPAAAAKPAPEKPTDAGRVNATHPAREGRGAGNLRDAIRRQRAAGQPSARKAPAPSKRAAPRTGGARRGK